MNSTNAVITLGIMLGEAIRTKRVHVWLLISSRKWAPRLCFDVGALRAYIEQGNTRRY